MEPRHFDVNAKDLVRRLLTADKTKRIGCLRAGAEDIKSHKWFDRLSWDAVLRCTIPVPFTPKVGHSMVQSLPVFGHLPALFSKGQEERILPPTWHLSASAAVPPVAVPTPGSLIPEPVRLCVRTRGGLCALELCVCVFRV